MFSMNMIIGITTGLHGPYGLGYTRVTMVDTIRNDKATLSKTIKSIPVQIAFCNSKA